MKQQVERRKHREKQRLHPVAEEEKEHVEDLDQTAQSVLSRGFSNNNLEQSFDLFALQDAFNRGGPNRAKKAGHLLIPQAASSRHGGDASSFAFSGDSDKRQQIAADNLQASGTLQDNPENTNNKWLNIHSLAPWLEEDSIVTTMGNEDEYED